MLHIKPGANIKQLCHEITSKLIAIEECFTAVDADCTITSGNDGKHKQNSKHYSNEAVDLRILHVDKSQWLKVLNRLKEKLGKDFDIILENDHIHLEYDPKG